MGEGGDDVSPEGGEISHELAGHLLPGHDALDAVPVNDSDDSPEADNPKFLPDVHDHRVHVPVEPLVVEAGDPLGEGGCWQGEHKVLVVVKLGWKVLHSCLQNSEADHFA